MRKTKRARYQAERFARLVKAYSITADGHCPCCGTKLYRNNSLAGWFQCGHYGSPGFQREAGPHCDFQIFYDATPEESRQVLAFVEGREPSPWADRER